MNDLTTTPNSQPARPTTPELSPELTALLDSDGSPDAAVRMIADTLPMLAEARAALPALKAVATAKAGRAGVKAVVGKRFGLYQQPQRTEAEWDAWWADYFDVLEDVALASLEAGMRAYVALPDSEFMPKPGRLRELAFSAPCRSLTRVHRATLAIRKADEPTGMGAPPKADPDAVKQLLADFKAKHPPRPEPKGGAYIGGIPDETGITQEMRDAMARRQEMAR